MDLHPTCTAEPSQARVQGSSSCALVTRVFPDAGALCAESGLEIGRTGPLSAWLEGDAQVSRAHAQLLFEDGHWWLEDLRSRNGTRVDGLLLTKGQRVRLGSTAVLRVGDTVLVFRQGSYDAQGEDDAALPGRSPPMQALRAELRARAVGTRPLLVLGETGTGKEHVVHWIHLASGRQHLEIVHCGLLARELVRAELFGIEDKTATGVAARSGAVRRAHCGSLFLDEIGELPPEVQPVLLRFLQDGRYRPVGGSADRDGDVRVIAATHQELGRPESAQTFRRDLYHRLTEHGAPIVVPPLRARPEDIVAWAERFLSGRDRALSAGAAEELLLHPWTGNLRELRGVLHTADARWSRGEPLTRAALELSRRTEPQEEAAAPLAEARSSPPLVVDADGLRALLVDLRGNVSRLAQRLGTSRRSVHRACDRFGLDPDDFRGDP